MATERQQFRDICQELIPQTVDVEGDFIEFGVHKGDSLRTIISWGLAISTWKDDECVSHRRQVIGVDSFCGLAEPSCYDKTPPGEPDYPKGKFDIGGMANVHKDILDAHEQLDWVTLYEGFVPAILESLPDGSYAFAHVDLDHHNPTLFVLEWLWGRMSNGGIILCHDWFRDRHTLAASAIKTFQIRKLEELAGTEGKWCWFKKKVYDKYKATPGESLFFRDNSPNKSPFRLNGYDKTKT